jgi:hypothetical protein
MLYFVFGQVLSFLFDLFMTTHSPDHHKDIQILLLLQQVRILQRKQTHPPCISRWEKSALAILAARPRLLNRALYCPGCPRP